MNGIEDGITCQVRQDANTLNTWSWRSWRSLGSLLIIILKSIIFLELFLLSTSYNLFYCYLKLRMKKCATVCPQKMFLSRNGKNGFFITPSPSIDIKIRIKFLFKKNALGVLVIRSLDPVPFSWTPCTIFRVNC